MDMSDCYGKIRTAHFWKQITSNNFKIWSEKNLTSCSVTYDLYAKQSSSENPDQAYSTFLSD